MENGKNTEPENPNIVVLRPTFSKAALKRYEKARKEWGLDKFDDNAPTVTHLSDDIWDEGDAAYDAYMRRHCGATSNTPAENKKISEANAIVKAALKEDETREIDRSETGSSIIVPSTKAVEVINHIRTIDELRELQDERVRNLQSSMRKQPWYMKEREWKIALEVTCWPKESGGDREEFHRLGHGTTLYRHEDVVTPSGKLTYHYEDVIRKAVRERHYVPIPVLQQFCGEPWADNALLEQEKAEGLDGTRFARKEIAKETEGQDLSGKKLEQK